MTEKSDDYLSLALPALDTAVFFYPQPPLPDPCACTGQMKARVPVTGLLGLLRPLLTKGHFHFRSLSLPLQKPCCQHEWVKQSCLYTFDFCYMVVMTVVKTNFYSTDCPLLSP